MSTVHGEAGVAMKRLLALTLLLVSVSLLFQYSPVSANTYPITITQIRTLDSQGTPRSSFARGATAVIEVTIQAAAYGTSVSYLLIVEIFDSNGIVAFIGFVSDSVAPAQIKTSGAGYSIPASAPTGTYTARVFVWNGWPSVMGPSWEALAAPGQTTFQVT